jgi:hypothetical protein
VLLLIRTLGVLHALLRTAEREVKYKSDKKYWEEQQKVLAARLAALTVEMEAYRGAGKAQQLEERIQVQQRR